MKEKTKKKIGQKVIDEIIKSIAQIEYGDILITIHDSRVVQIEKKIKKRIDES